MNHRNPTTIVKRGGFLSAIAYGLFGMLTVTIICSAGVGLYALNVADRKVETVLGLGTGALKSLPELLPEIRESLPPVLSDALADVRDPDYRSEIELDAHLAAVGKNGGREVVINARNNGDKIVSLMALRIVLVDENEVPVRSLVTYAATPLTIDHEWRGPILPGSLRRCGMFLHRSSEGLTPHVEITDLRTWTKPKTADDRQPELTMSTGDVSQETRLATQNPSSD